MKSNTPSWVQLLYDVPPQEKQWPCASEWIYGIAFVLVFFVAVPWMMGS